jgi:cytochrome P450
VGEMMKLKSKVGLGLTLAGVIGCSSFNSNMYQEVYTGDRTPSSSVEAQSSYLDQINNYKLSKAKKVALPKSVENLLEAKGRMDLIFKFARHEPLNFFKELRERAPILKSEKAGTKIPNIYVVSSNKLVKEVLNANTVFTVKPYTSQMDKTVGPFMLGHEVSAPNPKKKGHTIQFGAEKMAMRHLMYKSGNDLEKVREITRATVKKALSRVSPHNRNHVDIVRSISRDVPINVVREYFGFDAGPHRMKRWSRATQHSFFHNPRKSKSVDKAAIMAGKQMKVFLGGRRGFEGYISKVKREIAEGKRDAHTDTVTTMIRASKTHAKYGLDETRLAANIMGLLVGAVETGSAAIVQSLEFILDNPEIYNQAVTAAKAGNDELFSKIVWESLRFNPVNPWVARYNMKEHTLSDGTVIEAGSLVLAATESAMFDESVFPQPEKFSTERDHSEYFHLGFTRHRCLGDDVAMAFVPETIKQLLLLPHVRRASAGSTPDFKDGPFPETWELRWGNVEKPYSVTYPAPLEKQINKLRTKWWIPETVGYILARIWNARTNHKQDIVETFKLLRGEDTKPAGVIKFAETAKLALDEEVTPGELKEACMDINKLSHKMFPNVDVRSKYCQVRIDFRVCYALAAKVLKRSSEESYYFCADENNFLTRDEKATFKENFLQHPSFNFLAK